MIFSDKLLGELNEQIKYELLSAQYYLAMAGYCADQDLPGFENFFLMQIEEERFHAMKFYNYIREMGGRINILGFEDPRNDFDSLVDLFKAAYSHEQFVTKRIYGLMDLATDEREHATISFLKWFVDEQIEEEAMMSGILKKLQRIGEDGSGIIMLDRELAQRVFTPPPTN